ncbi:MAG TPA: hypothetical protein VK689_17590, partial [Armatimonadota bacterium]|nr:hypothetical protein [Armatimonadota bacterium]
MVETALQLTTDDWRSLPAMPAGALPELQGGRLVGSLTVAAPVAHLATAPVDGSFRLTGASYLPAREGATPIPVSHLAARFRWAQQVLELPSVSVATDLGGAKANGRIYPRGGVYRMALDLTAQSADAGELAGRFTDELRLVGGEAQARLSVDAPVEELRSAAVSGTVDLKDARVIRAVEALGLSEIDAKSLHVTFGGEGDRWNVQRLAFNSPGLDLTASGNLAGGRIDAEVALNTDRWVAPKTLPVAGGALGFRGRVQGSVSDPHTLALAGDLKLDGAHLRHSDPRFALNGGVVSMSGQVAANAAHPEAASFNGELKVGGARVGYTDRKLVLKDGTLAVSVRGEGPISDPMRWVHTGEATLTDAHAAMDGREPQRLDRASARFVRDGDRFRWTGAQLAAAGVTATSDGEWSPAGHTASVTADVQDLARWGFKLPEGIGAKQYRVVARLAGTPENPLLSATGRLELEHLRVALQGAPPQVLDRVAGDFSYSPDGLRVTGLEGRGPAGTITASGEWAEGKQHLSLVAVGTDPAQLGFALPEGFRVKGFRLQAEVDGADARSVRSARGSVQLWNAQFPFGPGAAHHLDTVSAQLQWDGKRVVLSGIEAEGPVG